MTRRLELDSLRLYEAISERAAARGTTVSAACEAAGVSRNTATRLKAGMKVEADILLALLDWLGVRAVRKFTRPVAGPDEEEERAM